MPKVKNYFRKSFFITIIILALIYSGVIILINYNKPKLDRNKKVILIEQLNKKFPFIDSTINKNISQEALNKIEIVIDKEIDNLFEKVYAQISKYSDFHYSLKGEYTEIFKALNGKLYDLLKEKLFDEINFEQRLSDKLKIITDNSITIINNSIEKTNQIIREELNLSKGEFNEFIKDFIQISLQDMTDRFANNITIGFRTIGVIGGVIGGVIAKKIATKLSTKIMVKIATKLGIKLGTTGTGVLTGSTIGTFIGGPVGTIVGGVLGGAVTWIASDKIIIEIDQILHEEEFQEELKKLVDDYKDSIKTNIKSVYFQKLYELADDIKKNFENAKNKLIIDVMESNKK